jgi:hypothetical protein
LHFSCLPAFLILLFEPCMQFVHIFRFILSYPLLCTNVIGAENLIVARPTPHCLVTGHSFAEDTQWSANIECCLWMSCARVDRSAVLQVCTMAVHPARLWTIMSQRVKWKISIDMDVISDYAWTLSTDVNICAAEVKKMRGKLCEERRGRKSENRCLLWLRPAARYSTVLVWRLI